MKLELILRVTCIVHLTFSNVNITTLENVDKATDNRVQFLSGISFFSLKIVYDVLPKSDFHYWKSWRHGYSEMQTWDHVINITRS